MRRHNESPSEMLVKLPWPVSAAAGVLAFILLRWGPLALRNGAGFFQPFAKLASSLAPVAALFFGIMACVSFWFGKKRQGLVEVQTSLESLRKVGWKDFEFMLAEAYRRQGYQVDFSLGTGADGGVDLTLRKEGQVSLVQCKQWRTFSVGAPVIREQFGILTAEKADEVIIVTSGNFTKEAENFAQGKPIQLVDGPRLLELVKQVQSRPSVSTIQSNPVIQPVTRPFCPNCDKEMVLRTARRGENAGKEFWGCKDYPRCKGTRDV